MSFRATEQAANIVGSEIDAQVLAHAQKFPDLKILCPRCEQSIVGALWRRHAEAHALEHQPAPDWWEAL